METYTYANWGYNGNIINVECDTRKGIPAVDIVGLADGAVKESRERMRAAISNSGLELPPERILISLFPTDLRKEGASYDLPIALSVLARMKDNAFINTDDKKIKYDLEKGQNKIKTAYEIQRKRGVFNADLNMEQISKYCELDEKSMKFYETFTMNHDLTSREATNLLKVSLTVANMDGREKIQFKDLKQASEYAISDIAKMVMTFSPKKEKEQDSPAFGR